MEKFNQKERHVFISYVRENAMDVEKLCNILRIQGVRVWIDRNEIAPGKFWKDEIRKAIQTGSFFIACFSREYNERTITFMNEELNLAIEELRKRFRERAWFIPVLLSGEIPDWEIMPGKTLRDIQWVRLDEDLDAGMRSLFSAIGSNYRKIQKEYCGSCRRVTRWTMINQKWQCLGCGIEKKSDFIKDYR